MKKYKVRALLLSVLLIVSAFIMPLYASASADGNYTLTVKLAKSVTAKEGIDYYAYRMVDQNGKLTKDFEQYSEFIDLTLLSNNEVISDLKADYLKTLVTTLSPYISEDKIAYDYSAATDSKGIALFNIPKSKSGIYLILGSEKKDKVNKIITYPQSFIIKIPYSSEHGVSYDDITVTGKAEEKPYEPITIKVKKVWEDNDYPSRPSSVSIDLLKDGEVDETILLDDNNKWTHEWNELDPEFTWEIKENTVPDKYEVSMSVDGELVTVTNKYDYVPEKPDPDPGKDPEPGPGPGTDTKPDPGSDTDSSSNTDSSSASNADPTSSTSSAITGDSDASSKSSMTDTTVDSDSATMDSASSTDYSSKPNAGGTSSATNLPQTGQLWWPVPVLFAGGFVIFLAGLAMSRLRDDENEETK